GRGARLLDDARARRAHAGEDGVRDGEAPAGAERAAEEHRREAAARRARGVPDAAAARARARATRVDAAPRPWPQEGLGLVPADPRAARARARAAHHDRLSPGAAGRVAAGEPGRA